MRAYSSGPATLPQRHSCANTLRKALTESQSRDRETAGPQCFFWHPDHDAAMVGLLWSGTADRTSYAFSPMMNIHEELDFQSFND